MLKRLTGMRRRHDLADSAPTPPMGEVNLQNPADTSVWGKTWHMGSLQSSFPQHSRPWIIKPLGLLNPPGVVVCRRATAESGGLITSLQQSSQAEGFFSHSIAAGRRKLHCKCDLACQVPRLRQALGQVSHSKLRVCRRSLPYPLGMV